MEDDMDGDRTGWLDTNVILRYLLGDHPDQSRRARVLIESAERGERVLRLSAHVLWETVFILESQGYTRAHIADVLARLAAIPGIEVERPSCSLTALV
jgi:predicted nucleic acid-binding protein